MWNQLNFLAPARSLGPVFLRLALGYAFFWEHGKDKLMPGGSFDWGQAFAAKGYAEPWMLYAAAWTEFLAGFALILGLMTRWASVGLLGVMCYAIFKIHANDPYIGGTELPIAYAAALSALLVMGPGALSVDKIMLKSQGV